MAQKWVYILIRFLESLLLVSSVSLVIPTNADDWGVTQVNVRKVKYTWTISNFSFFDMETADMLESPIFSSGDKDEHKWRLRLYPKGYNSDYSDYMTLFLTLVSGNRVKVIYKLALLNGENKEIIVKSITTNFAKDNVYGYYEFIRRSAIANKLNNLLPDDKLTILAEITMNDGLLNISGSCSAITPNASSYAHADSFVMLLEDEIFSDVQLVVGEYEFPAHRAILASISPVFLAEFKQNEQNQNKSILVIHDVNSEIFREVLRFIYTGKIKGIDLIAKDVLPVANRYNIKPLKLLCEEVLCQNLNVHNAIDVLTLAELHGAEDLKLQASNYIVAHALKIVDTPSFKTMEVSQPHPILKIFRAMVDKSKN